MKKALLLIVTLLTAQLTFAQGYGKISGVVMDSTSTEPVQFATVAINDPNTGSPIDGAVCDEKGKFSINRIPLGQYKVVISFIGYESRIIPVNLTNKNDNIDLGELQISPKVELLNEVVVEGQKTLIEEKVDRTIYNAENDQTTRGGDATDVLRRVPMLTVDLDGNLSMRGNSNVRVLINNRPSTITAGSIADALKQIPAEDIKSVEVITSPSAKYDAEGSAGIINIITKKNVLQGATLGINSSAGLRGSNLGLNGAYRKGKLGISLGGWGRNGYNTPGSFESNQTTQSGDSTFMNIQRADSHNNNLFGHYTLGIDYDFNKNNFINSSVRYGVRNNKSYQDDLTTESFINGIRNDSASTLRDVNTLGNSGGVDVNVSFTHLYERPQREFSAAALYSRDDMKNNFSNFIYDPSTFDMTSRIKNLNTSSNEEMTLQVDYQTPITDNQLVETGVKGIRRNVSSDYTYYTAIGSDGPYTESSDINLSNVFNYQQDITAGYLSFTQSFQNKYSIKAGARYEYTSIDAHFQNEAAAVTIPAYGVLVPSINISKKLKQGNMIKAAFNRRIQRPSIRYLNPNPQQSNPLDITVGNPNLSPEYTNNYELSYSYYIKNTTLNFSGFYRNTDNAIEQIRTPNEYGGIVTNYENIGHENAYGFSLFANVNVGRKLSLNGGTDVYYSVLDNNSSSSISAAHNEGWVAGYRMFGSYNFSKDWGLQFFGFYRGRSVQLQGWRSGFGIYSLSVKRDFMNKKASIGFGAENFLTNGFKMRSSVETPTLTQTSTSLMHNLNFKVNFSIRLGQLGKDPNANRRHVSSITNDDLKPGGDEMMSGEEMQQQQSGGRNRQGGLFRRGNGQQGQQPQQNPGKNQPTNNKKQPSNGKTDESHKQ